MPTLTLKFKDSPLALFNLEPGRSLKIGRSTDNDVVINAEGVIELIEKELLAGAFEFNQVQFSHVSPLSKRVGLSGLRSAPQVLLDFQHQRR